MNWKHLQAVFPWQHLTLSASLFLLQWFCLFVCSILGWLISSSGSLFQGTEAHLTCLTQRVRGGTWPPCSARSSNRDCDVRQRKKVQTEKCGRISLSCSHSLHDIHWSYFPLEISCFAPGYVLSTAIYAPMEGFSFSHQQNQCHPVIAQIQTWIH